MYIMVISCGGRTWFRSIPNLLIHENMRTWIVVFNTTVMFADHLFVRCSERTIKEELHFL